MITKVIEVSAANKGRWLVITGHFKISSSQSLSVISVLSGENFNSS